MASEGFPEKLLLKSLQILKARSLFRRRQNAVIGFEENPRGSSTDNLECLFSMCHGWLGPVFTLKEFKMKWRKIVR